MHDTAYAIAKAFLDKHAQQGGKTILEIGSLDVNGSLRVASRADNRYIGVDIETGPSVDLVAPSGALPILPGVVDLVLTSSVFEHDVTFWLTFLEAMRVLKPGGLLYVNAPSNGGYHAYPVDNWRFYADAGLALAKLATHSGISTTLVESFIANRSRDGWNDFVGVFQRAGGEVVTAECLLHPNFAAHNIRSCFSEGLGARQAKTDDMQIIERQNVEIACLQKRLATVVAREATLVALTANTAGADHAETEPQPYVFDRCYWDGGYSACRRMERFRPGVWPHDRCGP